jgi:aldehyde oxidoreductase
MMQGRASPPRPGEIAISLTVNGVHRALNAPPFASLAESLRDRLGLTGTKIGCEAGDCGACTVLLEGRQVCACLVATAQADGGDVITIEYGEPDSIIGRLQSAFLAHGAAQCGICTPGMIMAAASLLLRDRAPGRQAVCDAIGGVLCRCTGYQKIVEAVMDAASDAPLAADEAAPGSAVGRRIARADGWPKVTGTDRFGADEAPAGCLWMRAVRSPHARARFTLGDLDGVQAAHPGLVKILTAKDIPGANSFGIFPDMKDQPVLAPGAVRFRGEAVMALVGSREAIMGVRDSDLPIVWHVQEPVQGCAEAVQPCAVNVHENLPGNVLIGGVLECGDVAEGHRLGAATCEGAFETAFVEHAYIEPEAGYAVPLGPGPDRIEIAACTQSPYMDRDEVARVLGIAPQAVRIRPTACGGGFGGKLDVSVQPLLAVAAWAVRRPVRMVYSRVESMTSTTKRHPSSIRTKASADSAGRLTAYEMDGDFNTGAYASWGPTIASRVPVHASGPYRVPHVRNRARAIHTNETPAGAFRGFGVPQAAIAGETLLDDLAEKLGLDRWKIRRINALANGDATPSGQMLHASARLPQCLDALKADYEAALIRAAIHNANLHHTRCGVGIACMWYGCGNTSMSNPSRMRVTLGRDGRLVLYNGAVDIGQGSTTIIAQICADALGLPVSAFEQVVGDTDLTYDAGKTSASRQTLISGNAARLAGEDLRRKILSLANVGPEAKLSLNGARLTVTEGEARRSADLANLKADEAGVVLFGEGYYDPPTTPLDAKSQGAPYAAYGFAAQLAEVEVDMRLGTVKVLEIVAAHDVGKAINPALVEGQIHGGIAQGLGLALMEEFIPGRTENLHDYLIPTVGDMPKITVKLIEDPDPEGPYGAKGVGEPALIATAPAILGAIRHATGVTMRRVPVLPHRLWEALRDAGVSE